ncbi:MAG TPA: hypothetical protein DET40_13605 [Lentisphaeria bacterium]|nr:hypothetical protein [Lentisphaeria bacterium]
MRRFLVVGPSKPLSPAIAFTFAIVQEYMTKDGSEGFIECHRKYIDVQYVASGISKIPVEYPRHIRSAPNVLRSSTSVEFRLLRLRRLRLHERSSRSMPSSEMYLGFWPILIFRLRMFYFNVLGR